MGRYVNFDKAKFESFIKEHMVNIAKEDANLIQEKAALNLSNVQFSKLDMKYQSDIIQSVRFVGGHSSHTQAMAHVIAGGKGQAFRAIYYEFGTGTKMRVPTGYSPSSDPFWNPSRPKLLKERHWVREVSYFDMGGNLRVIKGYRKARPLSEDSHYGKPANANFWLYRAVNDVFKEHYNTNERFNRFFKDIKISRYIKIKDIRV